MIHRPMLNRRSFLHWSCTVRLRRRSLVPFTVRAEEQGKMQSRDETLTKGRPTDVESLAQAIVMKKTIYFLSHGRWQRAMGEPWHGSLLSRLSIRERL